MQLVLGPLVGLFLLVKSTLWYKSLTLFNEVSFMVMHIRLIALSFYVFLKGKSIYLFRLIRSCLTNFLHSYFLYDLTTLYIWFENQRSFSRILLQLVILIHFARFRSWHFEDIQTYSSTFNMLRQQGPDCIWTFKH